VAQLSGAGARMVQHPIPESQQVLGYAG
jgi:hypothetical protein